MVGRSGLVLLESDVTGQASVVSVIDLFGVSEGNWVVESVQLIIGLRNVILNTVAIYVINFSLLDSVVLVFLARLGTSLEQSYFCVLNWFFISTGCDCSDESQHQERCFHFYILLK